MRRRIKSPTSVVTIKRTIAAVQKAGVPVASITVQPDGTIIVSAGASNDDGDDIFAKWADRL